MHILPHLRSISGDRRAWAVFLSCWVIYLFHIGPVPGVNENRYIDLTLSIVEDGTVTIDRYHYNTVDKSYRDGHYYAGAAPGPALLGILPYLALKMATAIRPVSAFSQYNVTDYIRREMGMENAPDEFIAQYPFSDFVLAHIIITAFVASLSAAGVTVLLFQMFGWQRTPMGRRLWITAVYAFGAITFFYASRLYAHMPAVFFCLGGFYILWSIRHNRLPVRWGGAAGLMLGLSVLMEYTTAPMVCIIGLYGLLTLADRRRLTEFVVGGIIPGLFLCGYHYICFGSPFSTPYSFPMSPENPGPHVDQMDVGIGGFGLPGINSLWGLSFSPHRGIFIYMPILIIAVYSLFIQLKDTASPYRLEWRIIATGCAMQFLFNASMINFWFAGYVWGPRYLIPLIPFLFLAIGPNVHRIPGWLLGLTGGLSILINWTGVQYIVPQNAFGGIGMFMLSGPTTQFYQFIQTYFTEFANWDIQVSSLGGWLILGFLIWGIWHLIDRRLTATPQVKRTNETG